MTDPEGNSSFCFPRIAKFPRGAAEGNIELDFNNDFKRDRWSQYTKYIRSQGVLLLAGKFLCWQSRAWQGFFQTIV